MQKHLDEKTLKVALVDGIMAPLAVDAPFCYRYDFAVTPFLPSTPSPPHRLAQCFALELLPWCDDRMCNEERLRIYTSLMVGLRAEQHSRAGLRVPQRSMWMHCQRAISELGVSYPSCSPEIRTGRFSEAWKPRDPEGCKGDNNESLGSVRGAARSQL